MKIPTEAPKLTETRNGETRETHPAYGKISISSPSGHERKLFGSNIPHSRTINIIIQTAELDRKLGTEWIYGREVLLDIELTPSQFSHMISSVGSGTGTPCTFSYKREGDLVRVPTIDETLTAEDTLRNQFKETISKTLDGIDAHIATVNSILEKGRASKSELNDIVKAFNSTKQQIINNLPFYVNQFNEHINDKTHEAIMQVEATIKQNLNNLGLESAQHLLGIHQSDKQNEIQ